MATFSSTLTHSGVIGDLRYEIYTLTNVDDDSGDTVTTAMTMPMFATATCDKAASDLINIVSISGQTITIDASTADDDGKLFVIGK